MRRSVCIGILLIVGLVTCVNCLGDAPAAVKTGDFDVTFTERSPLSAMGEIARRLRLKDAEMGDDYDLSKRPFKALVPTNYDATVPCGLIVYLGYKDSTATPANWKPVMEKSHLIFITPVCHSGLERGPSVPAWESMGLALDAVHNLKKQYAIDDRRVYLMDWGVNGTLVALAASDVFRGFIVGYDQDWWQPVLKPDGTYFVPAFVLPPRTVYLSAKEHPFFLFDDQSDEDQREVALKASAMKVEGFEHVMQVGLSAYGDAHYPNLRVEWFEQQALPFLDQFSTAPQKPPTTLPDEPDVGYMDLTFTERSPTSAKKELARRFNVNETGMETDYDLSKCPFKAYVPVNDAPGTPEGVIVYLGFTDTTSVPPFWAPALERKHLIFISPVCHSGDGQGPSVPDWQSAGLAMDAVYNLKKRYAIDDKRVYQMSWGHAAQIALATSDLFTGFISVGDPSWCKAMRANNGGSYAASFTAPPGILYSGAKTHPFLLGDDPANPDHVAATTAKANTMQQEGFEHVMQIALSLNQDLLFPNMKVQWLEQQALPYLDQFASTPGKGAKLAEEETTPEPAASRPAEATTQAAVSSVAPSKAASWLSVAKILITNGQTDLARSKLRAIIAAYPDDPAAAKAKDLLQQLDGSTTK
jgi:hypothetical protein